MADEQQAQTDVQEQESQVEEEAEASAATENTETAQTEHMIPKSRFDAINDELKKLRTEQSKAQKAREEAERKAAEEQGEFKKLYEQAQAKAAEAEARAKAIELQGWRDQAARKAGLPETMAARLMGETLEELEADAKTLAESLPRAPAPNINAQAGSGAIPRTNELGGLSPEEFGAVFGVNPKYLNQ